MLRLIRNLFGSNNRILFFHRFFRLFAKTIVIILQLFINGFSYIRYEVYFITDASGGTSVEAHEMAVQRMIQAGGVPITTIVFQAELQRDWARSETAGALVPILFEHGGAIGTSLQWEFELKAQGQKK